MMAHVVPLPDLNQFCIPLLPASPFCVTIPGGAKICVQVGIDGGDLLQMTQALLAQVNTALAPLQPMFDVILVIEAIIQCVQAIPDALGLPPDPSGLIKCIPNLLQKLAALLALLPQLVLPLLLKQILNVLTNNLLAIKLQLQAIIAQETRILAATQVAKVLPLGSALQGIIDCETGNLDVTLLNLNAGMAPLNELLAIINIFLSIIGLQGIPSFADLGQDAQAALQPLDDAVQVLQAVNASIPLPTS